jgi:hypothetical protein
MPQDMNSNSNSLSDTSWNKSTSDSIGEDVARARSEAGREGSAALNSLKQGARSLGDEAKDRAAGYVEEGREAVTEHLDAFAQAIRRASDELSEKDQTMAAQLVRQAAGGLESLSRSIGGASMGEMINSVRSIGRRNPTAFIGGAVLAGLALGRFARASSRHDDDWRGSDWDSSQNLDSGQYGSDRFRTGGGYEGDRFGNSEGMMPSPYSGSSYAAGERSSFAPAAHGGADIPPRGQGYAGGGMGNDPIQSSGPSSDTDSSVTGSSFAGGSAQPGSISTGDRS